MSTNAHIFMKMEDGTYKGIYVHHDGYVERVGKMLVEHYTDLEKIKELISLGHLSVLGPEIGKQVNFDTYRNYDQCLAYTRDRGEDFEQYEEIDENELLDWGAYVYLFKDNTWYFNNHSTSIGYFWSPVSDFLTPEEKNDTNSFTVDLDFVYELNKALEPYDCSFKFTLSVGTTEKADAVKIVPKSFMFLNDDDNHGNTVFDISKEFYIWFEQLVKDKYNAEVSWNSTKNICWIK